MKIEGEAQALRIFVGESDRWDGRPLYEALVRAARDHGLKGATALRGIEGFGANDRIHTVKVLRLSEDLPIVVEIVDRADRIASFLPTIDKMVTEGTVTIERVHTIVYRQDGVPAPAEDDELQLESNAPQTEAVSSNAFTPQDGAVQVLEAAREAAANSRRPFVDSVDVLLAMLCESSGVAKRALKAAGIDCALAEQALREAVSRDEPSPAYLKALQKKGQAEARWLELPALGTENLLLALCEIRPTTATDILMRLGAQPRDVCKEVLTILGREDDWQRWLADHPDM